MATLQGSIVVLNLYDVAEEIKLTGLPPLTGGTRLSPTFKPPTPAHVRFERPPVIEPLPPLSLSTGERFEATLQYYDYGVVSIKLERPFQADWPELTEISSRWMTTPELEAQAVRTVRGCLSGVHEALIKPYDNWLSEDYYIIQLKDTWPALTAGELIAGHGAEIARIVRGEQAELSAASGS